MISDFKKAYSPKGRNGRTKNDSAGKTESERGRAPTTQAGEFVREEMEHIREGKHGARSAQQAIAIGLSKARKAGVPLPPYGRKNTTDKKRRHQLGPSTRRSQAISNVLKKESRTAASPQALAAQTHRVAQRRGPTARHRSAMKAVNTKGPRLLRAEARKAAKTRKEG